MRDDLTTQIEQYTAAVIDRQRPITSEEAQASVAAISDPPKVEFRTASRRRGWLIGVAGAVTVLAVGLLTVLTRGTAPEVPVLSQPSPSPTVATPAPTPSPTVAAPAPIPSSAVWSAIPGSALGAGMMTSVTVGGPGLVAVGSTPFGDHPEDAAVWTSVDGITWNRIPHDEEVFGGGSMSSVTAGGPGLVAVGSGVWTSADGLVWSRVPDDDGMFDDVWMKSVTVGGPGLVAVGDAGEGAAVWTSVDGIVWSRVPHDEATFGGTPDGGPSMWHVTEGEPGLVAVGIDWSSPFDADAVVWTSVDGFIWTRVPHDEEVFGGSGHQAISGVTAAGPGLVAVGVERSTNMQGVIWTSVDGLTWTRVAGDESGSLDAGQMNSVAVGDSGLVAVGWIGRVGGPYSDAAVWTSGDGIVWTRVPHDDEAIGSGLMCDLINTDSGLVAVGSDGMDAAVWVTGLED